MNRKAYLLTYSILLALPLLALAACGSKAGGSNPPPPTGETGTVVITGINKDVIP